MKLLVSWEVERDRVLLLAPLGTGADTPQAQGHQGSSTSELSAAMPSSGSRGQQGACLPGMRPLRMWWWLGLGLGGRRGDGSIGG